MHMTSKLKALALIAGALLLPACVCHDGDIGSEVNLSRGGGTSNIPLSIVENAVWLPYKAVVTPMVGTVQGGVGWYEVTGEPVSATLTLPLGMALGLIHGSVNAIGQEPFFVERDDNLFQVLANPFITDQETWKYSTPPHARPRYMPPQDEVVYEVEE